MFDLDLLENKRKIKLMPLVKKENVEYEIENEKYEIERNGRVLSIIERSDEVLILYRTLYDVPEHEESSIHLKLSIITSKGRYVPNPLLYAHFLNSKTIALADVQVHDQIENNGYGKILLEGLIQIAHEYKVADINGFLAARDNFNKLKHFYSKVGFTVDGTNINWTRKTL
ncbi:GNAT family N-acetyltransferase [Halobacillus faecis]|uniref:N-acetyltransferase domain-containing protein n=1 Tax=Halobacillus faecis TaxID=360184 RepID=A0A511WNN0_9BACI|nr:GNAT family N-acetyltransferase [Halobacillus faecis]GEN52657.1 hypothetical protein HFA01_09190 [Halobacillus faecis]